MPQAPVKLFGLSTCVHCRHAREFLEEHNVTFECVYVDKLEGEERKSTMDEVRKYNPRLSFPTLIFSGSDVVVIGFKKEDIIEALHL